MFNILVTMFIALVMSSISTALFLYLMSPLLMGDAAPASAKAIWRKSDHGYFTRAYHLTGRTRFRDDLRAIVGGALAAAFLAAALSSFVHIPFLSVSEIALIAAGAGAIAGKIVLA
jgi:hypothetical protein